MSNFKEDFILFVTLSNSFLLLCCLIYINTIEKENTKNILELEKINNEKILNIRDTLSEMQQSLNEEITKILEYEEEIQNIKDTQKIYNSKLKRISVSLNTLSTTNNSRIKTLEIALGIPSSIPQDKVVR